EAVGSFYQAVAGQAPLTKWRLPATTAVTTAEMAPGLLPAAAVAWEAGLSRRVVGLQGGGRGFQGLEPGRTPSGIPPRGKWASKRVLTTDGVEQARRALAADQDADAARKHERPDRIVKLTASQGVRLAVAYWGGTVRIVAGSGKPQTEQQLPQDVTTLTWS